MKSLRIVFFFFIISLTTQARSIIPIPITELIYTANKIVVCRFIKIIGDSSQFSIVKVVKGEGRVNELVMILTYGGASKTDTYYAIGEFENTRVFVISEFKMHQNELDMYQTTVNKVIDVYKEKNIKSKKKHYAGLLFWLIDKDFLKHDALYELSAGHRILYEYAQMQDPEHEKPDEFRIWTQSERQRILDIFIALKYPSYYEWNMSRYLIGFYNQKLKQHIYHMIDEMIIELEKDKYFITSIDQMFSILNRIETDTQKLKVIEEFNKDVHAYADHRQIDYLKKIRMSN